MKESKGILAQFLSISIGSWIAMLIGLLSTPIITRMISPDQFGKVTIFTLVVDILAIFSLAGMDQSFTRFFYEEDSGKSGLLYRCLRYALIIFLILTVLLLFFHQKAAMLFFSEDDSKIILILIAYIFLRIMSTFASVVVRMQQKGKFFSIIQVLNKSLEFVGILVFAYMLGDDYRVILYAHLFFMTIVTVIAIKYQKQMWFFFKQDRKMPATENRELVRFGLLSMLTQLMILFFQSVDKIAIRQWSSYDELGLYAAAFKIIAIINMIQINFTAFWTPVSYQTYKEDPQNTHFFYEIFETVACGMLTITAGVLLLRGQIIYFLGDEYHQAVTIMPFLVFVPLMYTLSEVTVVGINFHKKTEYHVLISGIVFVFNVVGNSLLVPVLGAIGAAVSIGITHILFFSLRTYFSGKLFQVPYNLLKFYSCLALLFTEAFWATFFEDKYIQSVIGIGALVWICASYRKTFIKLLKKLKI